MGQLEVVNDHDEVIGLEDYEIVHRGLRHGSVQVLVFSEEDLERVLVARRSQKQAVSKGLLHPSAAGHVKPGQTYRTAALAELQEELFHEHELPSGIMVVEVARYQNDTRETNKENTTLFYAVHQGPFFPDPAETEAVEFQDRHRLRADMITNPDKYTTSFRNAMRFMRAFTGDLTRASLPYILNNDEFEETIKTYQRDRPGEPIPEKVFMESILGQKQLRTQMGAFYGPTLDIVIGAAKRIMERLGYEYVDGAYKPTTIGRGV